jgi:hypothetical protein
MKKGPALRLPGWERETRGWDRYEGAIDVLRRHHLQTWAAFTLGHDYDTLESIRDTVDFAIAHRFCFGAFNILMPYIGTPLYERLSREGRLLFDQKWWLHPAYRFNHAAFRPRHLSAEELTVAAWEAKQRWSSASSVFGRLWDFRTHLSSPARAFVYLAYNPLYRKENFKKQGMRFGYDADSIHPLKPGPLADVPAGAMAGAGG